MTDFIKKVKESTMTAYHKAQVIAWAKEAGAKIDVDNLTPEIQPETKPVPTNEDLEALWLEVAKLYDVRYDVKHKNRTREFVSAKTHFARLVKMKWPSISLRKLAIFMGKDRTTIYNYWYYCGYNCDLPPFPHPKRGIVVQR